MTRRNDRLYLGHMLDYARLGLRLSTETTKDVFLKDEKTQLALIHVVQVVGEAARQVSPEGRAACPQLPWGLITGMRHRIVHDYVNVGVNLVWKTIVDDLPLVVQALLEVLPPDPLDDIDPSEIE